MFLPNTKLFLDHDYIIEFQNGKVNGHDQVNGYWSSFHMDLSLPTSNQDKRRLSSIAIEYWGSRKSHKFKLQKWVQSPSLFHQTNSQTKNYTGDTQNYS